MIRGERVLLRPVRDDDWPLLEEWARCREALWGPYQRFQLDHLPQLRQAYQQTGLLRREGGFLLIETIAHPHVAGFVRYSLMAVPDADLPYPEIGYGIAALGDRGKGYAREAVGLLVGYLFAGYPCERIAALTDLENTPSRKLLEGLGFQREGVLRRAMFRDGRWRDVAVYAILREEWPA